MKSINLNALKNLDVIGGFWVVVDGFEQSAVANDGNGQLNSFDFDKDASAELVSVKAGHCEYRGEMKHYAFKADGGMIYADLMKAHGCADKLDAMLD